MTLEAINSDTCGGNNLCLPTRVDWVRYPYHLALANDQNFLKLNCKFKMYNPCTRVS